MSDDHSASAIFASLLQFFFMIFREVCILLSRHVALGRPTHRPSYDTGLHRITHNQIAATF